MSAGLPTSSKPDPGPQTASFRGDMASLAVGVQTERRHTGCLCDAVIALLKVPMSFQRYFFQKLQSTSIKLALSPSPRTPSEPIPVQSSQQLALKVEGVVQHGSTPGLFRKIQSVCLNIPLHTKTNEIEQRVEPHNDYFSTQFLLNFSVLGTHAVAVEASVVDESGIDC
ncbi:hypothetical protein CRUP_022768 [Coryphaenoides rupestris]|nr:hypothetical protein CRUP_022768 [Coryphaenoides rupestris]